MFQLIVCVVAEAVIRHIHFTLAQLTQDSGQNDTLHAINNTTHKMGHQERERERVKERSVFVCVCNKMDGPCVV